MDKLILLKHLNQEQKKAVLHKNGPLLILAGPGSGKTKTITHKIAYLIAEGVAPENILALTFTNKAADEMRQRIFDLLKEISCLKNINGLTMGTFHSFGAMILRKAGDLFHHQLYDKSAKQTIRNSRFVIYDDDDSLSLIKEAFKIADISKDDYPCQTIQSAISKLKIELLSPKDFSDKIQNNFDEVVHKIYSIYEQLLEKNNGYDFDDLITKTVLYFKINKEILEFWQEKFKYILIDEYQDTNYPQYVLIKLLSSKHRNITVVGDDWQSIYSFRMADFRNILNFENDFSDAKVIILGQNYRSTKKIVEASNHIIKNNQFRSQKNLWTENVDGEAIFLQEYDDEKEEALSTVLIIKNLVERGFYKYNDCAVLYRTNAQSRALEEAFLKEGLAYNLVGDVSFYERKEVKDIVAYLKFLINPYDSLSLKRILNVPPRGIGQKSLQLILPLGKYLIEKPEILKEKLKPPLWRKIEPMTVLFKDLKELQNKISLRDFLAQVIILTGYSDFLNKDSEFGQRRLENIRELISLAKDFESDNKEQSLIKFLERISLYSENDKVDLSREGVNLMTLHIAKGLEFKVVFLVGLEEGILPHFKSFEDPYGIEEERRLCYVGITRAKERVYISFTRRRTIYGKTIYSLPSRFLQHIPPHLLQSISTTS